MPEATGQVPDVPPIDPVIVPMGPTPESLKGKFAFPEHADYVMRNAGDWDGLRVALTKRIIPDAAYVKSLQDEATLHREKLREIERTLLRLDDMNARAVAGMLETIKETLASLLSIQPIPEQDDYCVVAVPCPSEPTFYGVAMPVKGTRSRAADALRTQS